MTFAQSATLESIRRASTLFKSVARDTRLLETLQWPSTVETQFFEQKSRELPAVNYDDVDRSRAQKNILDLEQFAMSLDVADPIQHWLARVARSYAEGNKMIMSIGTKRFYEISLDVYGGPRSTFDHDTTNLNLALHLNSRLSATTSANALHFSEATKPALQDHEFASFIETEAQKIQLPIAIKTSQSIAAKVVAGTKSVRVRTGAQFDPSEITGLFVHEVETHALTAQNGAAQPELPFLKSGGPRTTRTQEGLAVFSELYNRVLPIRRMKRIVERVRLVAMAEAGADFLDLYRYLLEHNWQERDAFLDAQRICRGGLVEGGAPFTKDASYLAGLCEVHNFLAVAVQAHAYEAIETLLAGRIALEDLGILIHLRRQGILQKPTYLPRWVQRWNELVPYFAFASFLHEIDLKEVAQRNEKILAETREPIH